MAKESSHRKSYREHAISNVGMKRALRDVVKLKELIVFPLFFLTFIMWIILFGYEEENDLFTTDNT